MPLALSGHRQQGVRRRQEVRQRAGQEGVARLQPQRRGEGRRGLGQPAGRWNHLLHSIG
jgi:hypothetical protein